VEHLAASGAGVVVLDSDGGTALRCAPSPTTTVLISIVTYLLPL
jgi:hypothetical protein